MALLETGDENAGQEMSVPVPGRPTPLRVRTVPGNEVAFNPLTTVLFADSGTTTPAASQNGSIATPFSTVDAAAAVAADGDTIEVTPGTYSTTLTGRALAFVGMGAKRANASPSIVFSVVALTSSSASFADCDLTLDCSDTDLTAYRCALFGEFDGTGSLFALESTWSSLDGIPFIRASQCHAGEVTDGGDVELYDCALEGDVTVSGNLTIRSLRSTQAALTLTANVLNIDAVTYAALILAGATLTVTTLTVIDLAPEYWQFGCSTVAAAPASGMLPWAKTAATANIATGNRWIASVNVGRAVRISAFLAVVAAVDVTFTLFENEVTTGESVTVPAGILVATSVLSFVTTAGARYEVEAVGAGGIAVAVPMQVTLEVLSLPLGV